MNDFEVGGIRFKLDPMTIKESQAIYPNVMRVLGPVLTIAGSLAPTVAPKTEGAEDAPEPTAEEAEQAKAEANAKAATETIKILSANIGSIAGAAEEIPALTAAFAKKCKVQPPGFTSLAGTAPWVELAPMLDQTFARKHMLALEWLVQCIWAEFGDFLGGLGLTQ
jgi:hypothetical protein